mmetsp:Transcript_86532/g.193486  ORF Transcript_86532/g.193486 Transcript_86532/m.193486 type:complete len:385 (-) Transcript_86532:806-1960(-)
MSTREPAEPSSITTASTADASGAAGTANFAAASPPPCAAGAAASGVTSVEVEAAAGTGFSVDTAASCPGSLAGPTTGAFPDGSELGLRTWPSVTPLLPMLCPFVLPSTTGTFLAATAAAQRALNSLSAPPAPASAKEMGPDPTSAAFAESAGGSLAGPLQWHTARPSPSASVAQRRSSRPVPGAASQARPKSSCTVSSERRGSVGTLNASTAPAPAPPSTARSSRAVPATAPDSTSTCPGIPPAAETAAPETAKPRVSPELAARPLLASLSRSSPCPSPPARVEAAPGMLLLLPTRGICVHRTSSCMPAFCTTYIVRRKLRLSMPAISAWGGQKSPLSGPTSGDMEMMLCTPYIQSSDSPGAVYPTVRIAGPNFAQPKILAISS